MIEKVIESYIRDLYQSGLTQQEIADKLHLNNGNINVLLSGKRKVSGLRLATVEKMFPNATINLFGDNSANAIGQGNTAVNGNGNNFFSPSAATDDRIDRIIDAVMQAEDFTADVKVRLFGIIKNTK